MQAGQISEALMAFDRFKQENPKDPRPYLYSGIGLIKAGRRKDAGVELNQVAVLKPRDANLAVVLARALVDLDQLEMAARTLSEWEDSALLSDDGLWFLADLYYRLKLSDEALRVLEKLAQRKPDDKRVELRRGELFLMGRNAEQALNSFQRAVESQPDQALAYYGLGRAWHLKKDLQTARQYARKAVDLEPDNPTYLQLLGTICNASGESKEAIHHLERAVQSPAASSKVYFDLGQAYRRAGDLPKALQALKRYKEIDTDKRLRESILTNLTNQGLTKFEQGAILQAESTFKETLEIDPDHWPAHLNLTKIYLIRGDDPLAYRHLQKMQELDAESSEGNYFMALYWYERKDHSQALIYAEKAKLLRPGQPDLRNLLGNIYFALGQLQEAREEYLAAVNLAPDRFDFRANYESLVRRLTP